MKHLCTLCLVSLLTALNAFADIDKKVEINQVSPNSSQARSVVHKPQAWIDDQTYQLSVSFASKATYTLYVSDERGSVIHQEIMITDGSNHRYYLPTLDTGTYYVCIESDKEAFEGEFYIYQ